MTRPARTSLPARGLWYGPLEMVLIVATILWVMGLVAAVGLLCNALLGPG